MSKVFDRPVTTNELVRELDALWRAMLMVRVTNIRTLVDRDGAKPSDFEATDFYSIHCQVHGGKSADVTLCSGCYSQYCTSHDSCPFCNTLNMGNVISKDDITIDFENLDKTPNWEVDTDSDDMLTEKDIAGIPEIKPITKRDDIQGPKGKGKKRKKHKYTLSQAARKLIIWSRKKEFGKMMPFSPQVLACYPQPDLKAIAAMMPGYDRDVVLAYTTEELRQYILAKQPDHPIDPGPPPFGKLPKNFREDEVRP